MNILHLTHTDINHDSRILKEMQSIANNFNTCKVSGIGVELNEDSVLSNTHNGLNIYSVKLKSVKFKIIPKIMIHPMSVIEILFKMFFKGLKLKPSVIHCHDTSVLPLGVLLKLFTKSRLIYDAHELESNRNGLTKILGKMTLLVEKILWKFIDELIVVSPSIAKWYEENISIKQTTIILNSPLLKKNEETFDKTYFRNKFLIPNSSKIFLYIGILGEGRGIELIVEAFRNKNLTSHVVFLGYGALKSQLVKLSEEYSNIHVHNAVRHEEVVSVAKSADIGLCYIENVSLSDYFCLPNKLFEYAFAGIPILASSFPDIRKIVDKYSLGKYSELDSLSIYNSIKEFESIKELPKIDIEKLYDLSWAAQEGKLISLYNKLIKDKNNYMNLDNI